MSRIEFELAALRSRPPVAIDVADRVMQRVATLPQPSAAPHVRMRRPAAIAAGLAAIATGAAIVAGWVAIWPASGGGALEFLALLRGIGGSTTTVSSLSRAVAAVFELVGSIVRVTISAFEPLRPAANVMSAALVMITIATVVGIVVRDFSRARQFEEI